MELETSTNSSIWGHVPFGATSANRISRLSVHVNNISTCQMNLSATKTPSMYAPLETCRSMSLIQAADDSSKADRTLQIR